MKILVIDDDIGSLKVASSMLEAYGVCSQASNGNEGFELFKKGHESGEPYNLILLDIMMPQVDGHVILKQIRLWEKEHGIVGLDGVKIVMTTALDDNQNIMQAFRSQCEGYLVKPITRKKIITQLQSLKLLI
ncbi:MAG: response regulator [Chitinivibrionales bacterium]|nr:response regulator [Chitinivibrionales bacterium]